MPVMQAFTRLRKMARNPRDDWAVDDIQFVCRNLDLECRPPKHGSHHVVSHPKVHGLLTIPSKRPLKPFYIQLFVQMVESTLELE
jgi:hypothetical protein